MQDKSVIFLITTLFILLIGAGIFGYIYYNKYQNQGEELATSQLTIRQNEKYHVEIEKQKDDSLQTLSGLVKTLNKKNIKDEGEYATQISDLKLQIESLKDSGETSSIIDSDNLGEYLDIPFNGKKNIVAYNGFTRHYFNLNTNRWWIDFTFDPIDVTSTFYLDSNKVWKLNTVSNTKGITLRTDYHIDPAFYSHFENLDPEVFTKDKHVFILKLKAGIAGSWHEIPLYKDHPILLSAEVYYDFFFGSYHPLQKYVVFGIYKDIDLKQSFKDINKVLSIF